MIVIYGITNCDSVKKARKWLESTEVEYRFHDVRKDGLDAKTIAGWLKQCDWNTLLNRRSTSWKQLSDTVRNTVSEDNLVDLLLATPTLIKRPVAQLPDGLIVGFNETEYTQRLAG